MLGYGADKHPRHERLLTLSSIVDRLMHATRLLRFLDRTYKRFESRF
jgi:hypothetical protein